MLIIKDVASKASDKKILNLSSELLDNKASNKEDDTDWRILDNTIESPKAQKNNSQLVSKTSKILLKPKYLENDLLCLNINPIKSKKKDKPTNININAFLSDKPKNSKVSLINIKYNKPDSIQLLIHC